MSPIHNIFGGTFHQYDQLISPEKETLSKLFVQYSGNKEPRTGSSPEHLTLSNFGCLIFDV